MASLNFEESVPEIGSHIGIFHPLKPFDFGIPKSIFDAEPFDFGTPKSNIVAEHIDSMAYRSETFRHNQADLGLAVSPSQIAGGSLSFNTVNQFLARYFRI
jgi:hypothetical protein